MNLNIKAKYEGLKMARLGMGMKTPSAEDIEVWLWELFFTDKSLQNRILKKDV